MMKRALCLTLILFMALSVLPMSAEAPRKLTVMVYMCGSDLESGYGAASADLQEMLTANFDTLQISVLAMIGGTNSWELGFDASQISICEVGRHGLRTAWTNDAMDMGDPATLAQLLRFGVDRYPAEDYALILWNHGGGPLEGFCWDELFSMDNLSLQELSQGLSAAGLPKKLSWIGFDACLMASAETAHVCAPFAEYMVASQETEPGTGWNYSFLSELRDGLSGAEVGEIILERYMDANGEDPQLLTLSCVDLSGMDEVETAMGALFSELAKSVSPLYFSEISNGRRDAKSFGRASTGSEYDLVDLYNLAEHYADQLPDRVSALTAALDHAVISTVGNQSNSHGLSIYYPYYNKEYYRERWGELYSKMDFVPQYRDFLRRYEDIWLGEPLTDWKGIRAGALPPLPLGQEVTLPLSPEQVENFAYAQLYVLGRNRSSSDYCYKIDEIDDVVLDADGVLHANYNYKALYLVDEDGAPEYVVTYRIVDGYYLIRANLTDLRFDRYWSIQSSQEASEGSAEEALNIRKVYLQCLPNATGDGLDVVGVIDLGKDIQGLFAEYESLNTGKQLISSRMKEWKWLWLFHFPRELRRDDAGDILPFDLWENPKTHGALFWEWTYIDNTKPWTLKFIEQPYTGQDLYAQYIIHDTQGNLMGSNLISLENPNLIHAASLDEIVFDSDSLTLTASGVDLANSSINSGLSLRFDMADHRRDAGKISLHADNIILNRCKLDKSYDMIPGPETDGHASCALNIPSEDIPDMLETQIDSLRFDVHFRRFEDSGQRVESDDFTVELHPNVDISAVHTFAVAPPALAQARLDNAEYRLLDISEDDGCISLKMRVDNLSSKTLMANWTGSAIINGYEWDDAVSGMVFEVPGSCWTVQTFEVYESPLSAPAHGSQAGIATADDYPNQWNIAAIRSMEFVDGNADILRLELQTPFALSLSSGDPVAEVVEQAAIRLLETDDMTVDLRGAAIQADALKLVVDIANQTSESLDLVPRACLLNGVPTPFSLETKSGSALGTFANYSVPAGHRNRLVLSIAPDDTTPALWGIETIEASIIYKPENAEIWQFCTLATLRTVELPADAGPSKVLLGTDAFTMLADGAMSENLPRAPLSLVDVRWNASGNDSDGAVTLRASLTESQVKNFDRAVVWLAVPTEDGLRYLTRLEGWATLENDNTLSYEYNGLLIQFDGAEYPPFQTITSSADGYIYSLGGSLTLYTELSAIAHYEVSVDSLDIALRPDEKYVAIERVETSPAVGDLEELTLLEFVSLDIGCINDGGSVEDISRLIGERIDLKDGLISLSIRSAADFEPTIVFRVFNKDESEYFVQSTWRDAVSQH